LVSAATWPSNNEIKVTNTVDFPILVLGLSLD